MASVVLCARVVSLVTMLLDYTDTTSHILLFRDRSSMRISTSPVHKSTALTYSPNNLTLYLEFEPHVHTRNRYMRNYFILLLLPVCLLMINMNTYMYTVYRGIFL